MKAGAGNTLTPLGPLGLSLRDDDTTSSPRPRRQQPSADAGYSADELQVLRSPHNCSDSVLTNKMLIR